MYWPFECACLASIFWSRISEGHVSLQFSWALEGHSAQDLYAGMMGEVGDHSQYADQHHYIETNKEIGVDWCPFGLPPWTNLTYTTTLLILWVMYFWHHPLFLPLRLFLLFSARLLPLPIFFQRYLQCFLIEWSVQCELVTLKYPLPPSGLSNGHIVKPNSGVFTVRSYFFIVNIVS